MWAGLAGSTSQPLRELAGNPVYTVLVPQRKIEAVLAARAVELGVEIRRGHAVTGFTQKDDSVVVSIDGSADLEARYLVGADGGKSLVRKAAGIGFPGFTNDRTVSRTAHVTVPSSWRDPATGGLAVPGYGVIPPFLHHRHERGLIAFAPFPDGRTLLSVNTFDLPEGAEPFDLADLRAAFAHVVGVEIPIGRRPATGRTCCAGSAAGRPGWPSTTGPDGSSWSVTPRTCTRRSAGPGSTWACRTR